MVKKLNMELIAMRSLLLVQTVQEKANWAHGLSSRVWRMYIELELKEI